MKYYYFVSYFGDNMNKGNGEVIMDVPLDDYSDIKRIQIQLNKKHPELGRVVIMNFQLLKIEK